MTTTNPLPPPPPPPKRGTVASKVVNDLIVKPTDIVLGQVGALGNDVASDVKGLGHFVLQPVVDILQSTSRAGNDDDNNKDNEASNADTVDMFAKTASAIFNSVIVYAIADIRNLIRNHRDQMIGDPDMIQQLITLPITDVNVMMIIMENLSLLQQMMKKGEIDFYISAVHRYRKELASVALQELSQRNTTSTSMNDQSSNIHMDTGSENGTATLQVSTTTSTIEKSDNTTVAPPVPPPPPGESRRVRTQRRRSIFESIQQQQQQQESVSNTLEVFDDEYSLKELVYAITVHRCVNEYIYVHFMSYVRLFSMFVQR